jgi:ubiquinone biosynthesis protein Coq4
MIEENIVLNISTNLTLKEGLERYYKANPNFVQNQDLWVGWFRVPWCDMLRHDIMHVITGYGTSLDHELKLIGFLLTALTWKRPWYYYADSFIVFLELLWQSMRGISFGTVYYQPIKVCQFYIQGIWQGFSVSKKIDAYIDPQSILHRDLISLRSEFSIQNAGTWD